MAEPFHPVNGVWKEINDTDWDSVIAEFEQLRQELVPMKLPSKVQRLGAIDQCVKSLEKMLTLLHYEKRQTVHDVVFFGGARLIVPACPRDGRVTTTHLGSSSESRT